MYFLLRQYTHHLSLGKITFAHHLSCHTCILHHSCSQLAYHSQCSGRDGAETAGPSSRPPEWRSQNGNQARAPIWCSGPKTLTCPSARETSVMGKEVGGGVSAPCPCLAVPGSPEVTDLPIVIRWPKWSQNPGSSGWTLQSRWHRPWWEWLLLSSQILRGLRPP